MTKMAKSIFILLLEVPSLEREREDGSETETKRIGCADEEERAG